MGNYSRRLLEMLHRRDVLCSKKIAAARFRSDDMRCLLVSIMFCGPWLIESLPYPSMGMISAHLSLCDPRGGALDTCVVPQTMGYLPSPTVYG